MCCAICRTMILIEPFIRPHKEGCPIYPHRVESSMVGIDSSHRKSSGERLSVKYIKDTNRVRSVHDSIPIDSSRYDSYLLEV